jgi:hypothetical protein
VTTNGNYSLNASDCFNKFMLTYGIKYHFFRFKETYEHPILRGNEKNASDREKRIGSTVAKVHFVGCTGLCFLHP